ncbi:DUF4263 domain-containing protein [Vibrio parahaemolyticus]|nr:DUF4263 domain-containing protein [Vibrio parahaemolyticus]EGQ9050452.1 DUF4263 domain-containing protein [Vibrio parahaemolyticus]EGQ9589669.1 DUF4263 domain-containing protein [Vibrio parahaemolyticus]EGR1003017.1 DUF4263 domain-containing protein [Vibrio parahaemolyticus]EGR1304266.1 DUF4263 domain-containing protein [Vibrio parahaemolyticus]
MLIKQFEKLYNDKANKEQAYQSFIESNPELVPRAFVQNHGVHMDLVFRKFPLGTTYKSDFMFLSKSSSDWRAVHIEIEDPNKKIFTKGGAFTAEFNAAVQQVQSWIGWFNHNANQQTFENDIAAVKQPLNSNPTKHKFVLVYGRRSELDTQTKKDNFDAKKTDNFELMTYDSLFSGRHGKTHIASFHSRTVKIHCSCELEDSYFGFVNPADFEINSTMKTQKISKLSTPATGTFASVINQNSQENLAQWQATKSY